MDIQLIAIVLAFIFSLSTSFFYLSFVNQKFSNENVEKKSFVAFLGIYIILAISICGLFPFVYDEYTFKYTFSPYELLCVFAFMGLIFISYSAKKVEKLAPVTLLLGCAAVSYFIPESYNIFDAELPILAERTIIVVGLFVFALAYKYINEIDGILITQTGTVGIGAIGLSSILSIPLLGAFGSIILAISLAFIFFNKYPAKIQINKAGATALGFFVGWFIVKMGEEISLSSTLLLVLFVIAEVGVSFLKKLSFREKYKNIYENGFCVGASIRGLYPDSIRTAVSKVLVLSVMLACFQTFAPNQYSVPFFGFIAILWLLYRMQEWEYYSKSLREMNKDTIEEIKDNIDEIKKYINKGE